MGLFGFIKGQFIDVIQWADDDGKTLVWRFPDEDKEVKMGAQLIVRESQAAIFINEGQIADVFGPGRHELTTRNMPILTKLKSWKYGFDSPFKVDIFFVSTRRFTNLKWGTRTPIQISDEMFMAVPMRAYGTFAIRVIDPALFFKELVGMDSAYTTDELIEAMRSRLLTKFGQYLRKAGKSVREIFGAAAYLGEEMLPEFKSYFKEFGLDMLEFNVENVTFPEEIQRQFMEQDMEMRKVNLAGKVQNMNKFMQYQIASNIGKGGNSPGGGAPDMMQKMLEMGMSMQMIQQMMGAMGGMTPNPMTTNMNQMQTPPYPPQTPQQESRQENLSREQVMKMLKELGELKQAGILTEEEFNQKKQELLAKL